MIRHTERSGCQDRADYFRNPELYLQGLVITPDYFLRDLFRDYLFLGTINGFGHRVGSPDGTDTASHGPGSFYRYALLYAEYDDQERERYFRGDYHYRTVILHDTGSYRGKPMEHLLESLRCPH